jgi:hypothetical protein
MKELVSSFPPESIKVPIYGEVGLLIAGLRCGPRLRRHQAKYPLLQETLFLWRLVCHLTDYR